MHGIGVEKIGAGCDDRLSVRLTADEDLRQDENTQKGVGEGVRLGTN